MHPTPLCGPEIVGILESGFMPTLIPIDMAARVMRKPLERTSRAADDTCACAQYTVQ
jgi:hypothetical protein